MAYRLIPAIFDAVIGPMLRTVSFTSGPIESTSGNVYTTPPSESAGSAADQKARLLS
jgi:hypothetical protein